MFCGLVSVELGAIWKGILPTKYSLRLEYVKYIMLSILFIIRMHRCFHLNKSKGKLYILTRKYLFKIISRNRLGLDMNIFVARFQELMDTKFTKNGNVYAWTSE